MTTVAVELVLRGSMCTDASLGFENPEDRADDPIWLPRSQIQNLDEVLDGLEDGIGWTTREEVTIHIPHWLAENEGLDPYAEEIDE